MNRRALLALAAGLLGAGVLLVASRSDRPAFEAPHDDRAGAPELASAGEALRGAAPARRAGGTASDASAAAPSGAPPEDVGAAGAEPPAALTVTAAEFERLVAAVGARGIDLLGDDLVAREAQQRLAAAGEWPYGRLLEVLAASESDVRRGAAVLLGLYGRPEAGRALADQLDRESDPTTRRVLLEALLSLEAPVAAGALERIWDAPQAPLAERRTALSGLAALGHPAARSLAADPEAHPVERRLAEIGLVRACRARGAGDPSLRAVLEAIAASSPHEASRREAAEALSDGSR